MATLEDRLAAAVSSAVTESGFCFVKRRKAFVRQTKHGFDEFVWSTWPIPEGRVFELVLSVRHDVVEQIVNELGLVHGADNQKSTPTVSWPIHRFPPSRDCSFEYTIPTNASDQKIQEVANQIADVIAEHGEPFFERYSSLSECAAGLNTDIGRRAHFLCNNLERRMYYAITTANLAALPERVFFIEKWRAASQAEIPPSARSKANERLSMLLALLQK